MHLSTEKVNGLSKGESFTAPQRRNVVPQGDFPEADSKLYGVSPAPTFSASFSMSRILQI